MSGLPGIDMAKGPHLAHAGFFASECSKRFEKPADFESGAGIAVCEHKASHIGESSGGHLDDPFSFNPFSEPSSYQSVSRARPLTEASMSHLRNYKVLQSEFPKPSGQGLGLSSLMGASLASERVYRNLRQDDLFPASQKPVRFNLPPKKKKVKSSTQNVGKKGKSLPISALRGSLGFDAPTELSFQKKAVMAKGVIKLHPKDRELVRGDRTKEEHEEACLQSSDFERATIEFQGKKHTYWHWKEVDKVEKPPQKIGLWGGIKKGLFRVLEGIEDGLDFFGEPAGRAVGKVAEPVEKLLQKAEEQMGTKIQFQEPVEVPLVSVPLGPEPKSGERVPREPRSVHAEEGQKKCEKEPTTVAGPILSREGIREVEYAYDPDIDLPDMVRRHGLNIAEGLAKLPAVLDLARIYEKGEDVPERTIQFFTEGALTKTFPLYPALKTTVEFHGEYFAYMKALKEKNPTAYQDRIDVVNATTFHPFARFVHQLFNPGSPVQQYFDRLEKSRRDVEEYHKNPSSFQTKFYNGWAKDPKTTEEMARELAPVIEELGTAGELDPVAYKKIFGQEKP